MVLKSGQSLDAFGLSVKSFMNVKWSLIVFCNLPQYAPSNCLTAKTQVEKCIHCGQLILRKISKFDATRCQILRLKCSKFDFRWGLHPDPAGGAYSASPDPLAVFRGRLLW